MGKAIWPALAVALLLMLAPSASAGTVRHASPTGDDATSNCTDAEPPCSLRRAVETVAVAGDEVIVAPGNYDVSSSIQITNAIFVHGTAGGPRPRVLSTSPGVFGVSGGGTLADVQLEAPRSVLSVAASSVAERVTVLASPGVSGSAIPAVRLTDGSILRDSFVQTSAVNGQAVSGAFGIERVVNVTTIATDSSGVGLFVDATIGGICIPPYSGEIHATNVIARGGLYDLSVPNQCSGTQLLAIGHSNFRRAKVNETRPNARVEDEGGNQDVEPLFAAAAPLDVHQLPGSPTIDAGAVTSILGSGDVDGEPRIQGGAPDIGADEFPPPPPPPPPEPPADTRRPVASLLAVAPTSFRARAARAARRRVGARVSYALDEAATVTFTVKRIVRRGRHTRYVPVRGSFSDAGDVGGNTLRFSGRLNGKRLKPGRYRLIALPVDVAGNVGNAVIAAFRIVR
jgi:hypothetical protein